MKIVVMMVLLKIFAGDLRQAHPRPDLYHENWLSLNGEWQFEIDNSGDGELQGLTYGTAWTKNCIYVFIFCSTK
jgi:hypothetical protein